MHFFQNFPLPLAADGTARLCSREIMSAESEPLPAPETDKWAAGHAAHADCILRRNTCMHAGRASALVTAVTANTLT